MNTLIDSLHEKENRITNQIGAATILSKLGAATIVSEQGKLYLWAECQSDGQQSVHLLILLHYLQKGKLLSTKSSTMLMIGTQELDATSSVALE